MLIFVMIEFSLESYLILPVRPASPEVLSLPLSCFRRVLRQRIRASGVLISAAFLPIALFGPRTALGQFAVILPVLLLVSVITVVPRPTRGRRQQPPAPTQQPRPDHPLPPPNNHLSAPSPPRTSRLLRPPCHLP